MIVLLIGTASAFQFDNVKNYDKENKEVTVVNALGLGSDVAKIKLISEQNVKVPRGYQKVAEFDVEYYLDNNGGLDKLDLYNIKKGMEKFERDFDYKIKEIKQVKVDDYSCSDNLLSNGTTQRVCKKDGFHYEDEVQWNKINPSDLLKNDKLTIGIFTDIEKGDYVEWIPTFFGVEIDEWATWSEALNVDIQAFWKLDDGGNEIIDSVGNYNGTNNGAVPNATGIINTAYDFTSGDPDWLNVSQVNPSVFDDDFSASMWFNADIIQTGIIFMNGASGSSNENIWYFHTGSNSGNSEMVVRDSAGNAISLTNISYGTNAWINIVIVYDDTAKSFIAYKNGTEFGRSGVNTLTRDGDSGEWIMGRFTGLDIHKFDGTIDEVGIWNRTLSASEVSDLWNGGAGISWTDVFGPIVTILFPLENTIFNETVTQLNYSVTNSPDRCWFSTDGGATNSSDVAAGTNFTGLTSSSLNNTWTVYCNNTDGEGSDSVSFFVNKSVQTELITPINASNFTTTMLNFSVNSTPTNTNLTNVTLSVWFDNATLILTNTTSLSGNVEVNTSFAQTLPEGNIVWNAETCGLDVDCAFAANNNTLTVHTTPSTLNITSPNGTINFHKLGDNLTLNWSITESGQNLTEHIINCSFTYNGVQTDLNQTFCIVTNQTSFLYVKGINNLTFTVTEEFGLQTTNFTSWNISILQNNETFDNRTTEGATETFTLNITVSSQVSSAILFYNNTDFIGTLDNSNFPEVFITRDVIIPSVAAETNISFFWKIITQGGASANTTSNNQTVVALTLDNCAANTETVLNYTIVDEETQIQLNAIGNNTIIEVDVRILSSDRTRSILNFSQNFSQINPATVCINEGALNGTNYSMDVTTRYDADNYEPEFHHIQSFMLTNSSIPQNITLFDLLSADSTSFLITFKGTDFLPISDALVRINRNYVSEGVFKTVEIPLTDDNGQTTGHFDLDNVKYQIIITKDGVILASFNDVSIVCANVITGDCSLSLNAFSTGIPITDFNTTFGLTYSTTFDPDARTITTIFLTQDGSVATILANATKFDRFGNTTVCTDSISTSSGTTTCTIPESFGNVTVEFNLFKNGEMISTSTFTIIPDAADRYGSQGPIFFFIIVITMGFLLMSSSVAMIIGTWITIVFAGLLMLFDARTYLGEGSAIILIAISGGLLLWKITRRVP